MFLYVALGYLLGCCFVSAHDIKKMIESINDNQWKALVRHAELEVQRSHELENRARYMNPYEVSAESRHQLMTCPSYRASDIQKKLDIITSDLVVRYNLDVKDLAKLRKLSLKENEISRQLITNCSDNRPTDCSNTKYPSIDGSCNNLQRPNEGRVFTCFQRFLNPDYGNKVDSPRIGKSGTLPEPRTISNEIHRSNGFQNCLSTASDLVVAFGQFLDHDIEFTTATTTTNNAPIQCCNAPPLHEACFPITIPPGDPDFPNLTCMNFVRNARCRDCMMGWREQSNSLTPAIDASQVYDTRPLEASRLRRNDGSGKLITRSTSVGDLPPVNNQSNQQCSPEFPCFLTGDFRSNQNLPLACLHVTFMRMHNVVAETLKSLNPNWNEETLYQESRFIIICILQKVVFDEYLPIIVGPELMNIYNLWASSTQYNSSLHLTLYNAFAAAGFRLHTTVPEDIYAVSENGVLSIVPLRNTFFNVEFIYRRGIEDIIRGGTRQCQDNFDPLLARALTEFMYRTNISGPGLDLASINIQRGRDQGLPGYVQYVYYFHGFQIRTFADLVYNNLMTNANAQKLQAIYSLVENVDLFTGLASEILLRDSTVGPTTAIIIAIQFYTLKYGNRFTYTHSGILTSSQKAVINRFKLSHVFCYANNMPEITEDVFNINSRMRRCADLAPLDLSPWKGKPRKAWRE